MISAIVAMSKNRVIGKNNQLPWKLPEDLKRFRALTTGYPVIMGRKTYESIGRPLPGRINIVISRQKDYLAAGCAVVHDLETAFSTAATRWNQENPASTHPGQTFIIGGAEIYRLAFPLLNRIYLTQIHSELDGDAFFPVIPSDEFKEASREERLEPFPFTFLVYDRC